MLIFWVSKGSLKVKVYYIEVMRILLLVLTFRILESWCSVSQLHFLRLREHRRRIIGSHENLGYRELLEAIWSSLLLGSGLISNWIMSPRDLSNQVLKNLQGQFPTVFRQPVPVLGHSHCTFFFFPWSPVSIFLLHIVTMASSLSLCIHVKYVSAFFVTLL